LKDGEVRYTPGNFAHTAINESERPFHNITIELLKPSANTKTCMESCDSGGCIGAMLNSPVVGCPVTIRHIASDQWTASLVSLPPDALLDHQPAGPTLLIAVTKLKLSRESLDAVGQFSRQPGGLDWIPAGLSEKIHNGNSTTAQFITLEFKADKHNQ
jgi:hypothetical protein